MRITRLSFPMIACAAAYAAGLAQAADRVAYVERQVVRYDGDRAIVVTEQVATVVPDAPAIVEKRAAPAVAAATFQRGVSYGFNRSHDCPGCGREQLVQAGRGPARGTHYHVCSSCSSSWYH